MLQRWDGGADALRRDRLEAMRKGGREGRAKVAVAARRLMSLAKEVEGVEGAEQARLFIQARVRDRAVR